MGPSTSLQAAPQTRRSPLSTHRWLRTTSSTSPFSPRCAAATPRAPSATARALTGGLPARVPLTCPCSAPDLARITPDLPRSRHRCAARALAKLETVTNATYAAGVRASWAGAFAMAFQASAPTISPDLVRSGAISSDLARPRPAPRPCRRAPRRSRWLSARATRWRARSSASSRAPPASEAPRADHTHGVGTPHALTAAAAAGRYSRRAPSLLPTRPPPPPPCPAQRRRHLHLVAALLGHRRRLPAGPPGRSQPQP